MTPGGERSGARVWTCRVRPGGKGLGGNGLGGVVWVWVALAWARYFAPSLPTAAAAAVPARRPWLVQGPSPVLRAAAWPVEAVARLAGAAVVTPHAPSRLPSAAASALGDARGSCVGATPRVGGVPGAAVGAAAWLQGLLFGRRGRSPRPARAPGSTARCQRSPAGGPTGTAASANPGSPAHSGETGERERDLRWWRSSRWGEPLESDITVILVGMRGGRCALPTTSRCISVVPWAVLCSALRGRGGEGLGGGLWRQPRTGEGRWPSIGIGRGGGGATRPTRCATAPSLGRGSGPWAPGGRGVVPRGAALRGPRNGGDLLCSQEGVYPVPRRGHREGGAGYGCCPIEVGGGDPHDPFRVPAGRD